MRTDTEPGESDQRSAEYQRGFRRWSPGGGASQSARFDVRFVIPETERVFAVNTLRKENARPRWRHIPKT